MKISQQDYHSRWGRWSQTLNNALAIPDLSQRLARYGYPAERIEEGQALLHKAMNSLHLVSLHRSEKVGATIELKDMWREVLAEATVLRQIARIVCKGKPNDYALLGLKGSLAPSRDGATIQIDELLNNCNQRDDLVQSLGEYGFNSDRLGQLRTNLASFIALKSVLDTCKSESKKATAQRQEIDAEFRRWMHDLTAMAKIAVADQPELFELFGYTVS